LRKRDAKANSKKPTSKPQDAVASNILATASNERKVNGVLKSTQKPSASQNKRVKFNRTIE